MGYKTISTSHADLIAQVNLNRTYHQKKSKNDHKTVSSVDSMRKSTQRQTQKLLSQTQSTHTNYSRGVSSVNENCSLVTRISNFRRQNTTCMCSRKKRNKCFIFRVLPDKKQSDWLSAQIILIRVAGAQFTGWILDIYGRM